MYAVDASRHISIDPSFGARRRRRGDPVVRIFAVRKRDLVALVPVHRDRTLHRRRQRVGLAAESGSDVDEASLARLAHPVALLDVCEVAHTWVVARVSSS